MQKVNKKVQNAYNQQRKKGKKHGKKYRGRSGHSEECKKNEYVADNKEISYSFADVLTGNYIFLDFFIYSYAGCLYCVYKF